MLTIRGGAPSPTLIVAGNFIAVLSYYKALLQNFGHLFCIFLLWPIKTRHGSDWNLMDQALIYTQRREEKTQNAQLPNLSLPLVKLRNYNNLNRLSLVGRFRVSKYFRHLYRRVLFSNVFSVRRFLSSGPVVTDSAIRESPGFIEEGGDKMEDSIETGNSIQQWKLEFGNNGGGTKTFADLLAERSPERCSRPGSPTGMEGANEEERQGSSSLPLDWPLSDAIHGAEKPPLHEMEFEKQDSEISEVARMKERFSKLLLGEDMSGRGNGVCAALAISKAITNLSATLFGKIWKLEPLHPMKKAMWERDKEWLLSVGDHIVEFTPTWQTFPDGSEGEVMTCRPRADLYVNLPALRKLDNMLIETLDSFEDTEFWYANQVIQSPKADGSSSSPGHVHHQEEKCRLPVPHVPPSGLSENSRKHLQQKRDCTNQILKAAQAINNTTLTEMEVPESYLEALPKNVRASLGEVIYRYITSGQFSPEHFLSHLDLTSEQALEVANRVEASINVWHQRHHPKPPSIPSQSTSRSSWETVKELMADAERRESLVERAEILLFCIKQKFPGLPQTTLRTSKIQFNKDIGKSILESYSRVLESLAADILVCIDDLLHMDDLMKPSDQYLPITKVGVTAHESISNPHLLPVSSTPHKTAVTASDVSQSQQVIPAKAETLPFFKYSKLLPRGFSKRKMSTDFRNTEREEKDNDNHTDGSGSISKATEKAMGFLGTKAKWEDENNSMEGSESISKAAGEASAPLTGSQSFELLRNAIKPPSQGSILGLTPSSRTWEDHLLTTRTRKPLDL